MLNLSKCKYKDLFRQRNEEIISDNTLPQSYRKRCELTSNYLHAHVRHLTQLLQSYSEMKWEWNGPQELVGISQLLKAGIIAK